MDVPRAIKKLYSRIERITERTAIRYSSDERPTSNPYITGDGFRKIADHIFDNTSPDLKSNEVSQHSIVFVGDSKIDVFFEQIHPGIKVPYTLITHNSDENISSAYSPHLAAENLTHWFAQNCLIEHPKITPIPIGIENKWLCHHGVPRYFDTLRQYPVKKDFRILYKFNLSTNRHEREPAHEILSSTPFSYTYNDWRDPLEYLSTLQKFAFVASPPGNGEDCIRTWEAMYLGTIPVVKRSVLTKYFEGIGLPLLLIDSWSEFKTMTPEKLSTIYDTMRIKFDHPALQHAYWVDKIKNL